jgi:hypothetical protein
MSQADHYRERAAEYQRQADAAVSPTSRVTLQDIAKKYLALAANEERYSAFSPEAAQARRSTISPELTIRQEHGSDAV